MAASTMTKISSTGRRLVYEFAGAAGDAAVTVTPKSDVTAAEQPLYNVLATGAGAAADGRALLGLQNAGDAEDNRLKVRCVPKGSGSMPSFVGGAGAGQATLTVTPAAAGTGCNPCMVIIEVNERELGPGFATRT